MAGAPAHWQVHAGRLLPTHHPRGVTSPPGPGLRAVVRRCCDIAIFHFGQILMTARDRRFSIFGFRLTVKLYGPMIRSQGFARV